MIDADCASAFCNLHTCAWSQDIVAPTAAGNYFRVVSLKLDKSGNPHVVFQDGAAIKYGVKSGASWSIETVATGELASLAMDPGDTPAISYSDDAGVHYAARSGAAWTTELVADVVQGQGQTSLAIDSAGTPHIAFYDPWLGLVRYAVHDGGGWTVEALGDGGDDGTSIAVDSSQIPHVCFGDPAKRMNYATIANGGWQNEVVSEGTYEARNCGIAVDASGNPHIGYFRYDNVRYDWTRYAHKEAGTWMEESLNGGNPNDGYSSISIVVDSTGAPQMVYMAGGTSVWVTLARRQAGNWTTYQIVYGGGTNPYYSLALDADDRANVVYDLSTGVVLAK